MHGYHEISWVEWCLNRSDSCMLPWSMRHCCIAMKAFPTRRDCNISGWKHDDMIKMLEKVKRCIVGDGEDLWTFQVLSPQHEWWSSSKAQISQLLRHSLKTSSCYRHHKLRLPRWPQFHPVEQLRMHRTMLWPALPCCQFHEMVDMSTALKIPGLSQRKREVTVQERLVISCNRILLWNIF